MTSTDDRANRLRAAALELLRDSLGPDLPWYDSSWLQSFVAVKGFLIKHHPDLVGAFEELLAPLRTAESFEAQHLPSFIDPPTMEMLRAEVDAVAQAPLSQYERQQFGRDLLHNRPAFTDLAHSLVSHVSELVGETVEPYYNFLSLYGPAGKCEPHMDAPEAKWTLDICVDQSDRWPLHVSPVTPWPTEWNPGWNNGWQNHVRATNTFAGFTMDPSDAVLFAGSSQWHYRDPFPGDPERGYCHLLFLHYIPAGAAAVVNPATWAEHLGIPAVVGLSRLYRSHYKTD